MCYCLSQRAQSVDRFLGPIYVRRTLNGVEYLFIFYANPIFTLGKNALVYQNRKQIIRNKLSATYFYRIKLIKAFHMWAQIKYLNK